MALTAGDPGWFEVIIGSVYVFGELRTVVRAISWDSKHFGRFGLMYEGQASNYEPSLNWYPTLRCSRGAATVCSPGAQSHCEIAAKQP